MVAVIVLRSCSLARLETGLLNSMSCTSILSLVRSRSHTQVPISQASLRHVSAEIDYSAAWLLSHRIRSTPVRLRVALLVFTRYGAATAVALAYTALEDQAVSPEVFERANTLLANVAVARNVETYTFRHRRAMQIKWNWNKTTASIGDSRAEKFKYNFPVCIRLNATTRQKYKQFYRNGRTRPQVHTLPIVKIISVGRCVGLEWRTLNCRKLYRYAGCMYR